MAKLTPAPCAVTIEGLLKLGPHAVCLLPAPAGPPPDRPAQADTVIAQPRRKR